MNLIRESGKRFAAKIAILLTFATPHTRLKKFAKVTENLAYLEHNETLFYRAFLALTFEQNEAAVKARDLNLKTPALSRFMQRFGWAKPALDFSPCMAPLPRHFAYLTIENYLHFPRTMPTLSFWGIKNRVFVGAVTRILSIFV